MAAHDRPSKHPHAESNSSPYSEDAATGSLSSAFPETSIPLTFLEKKLFDLLLEVTRQPDFPKVTLRVAGGWVRDKILRPTQDLGTHVDIDIALDTMLGIEFAEKLNDYLTRQNIKHGSIGLIQKNPDQSKHLETATMRVLDVCLDLVNLRTETYTHDSRIPNIQIGTPYEDAMRRDLTINALFYNINTGALEDFTDSGFDDIREKIIRTPLPPLKTLLDDPLRALRAIRFASRLNFKFDSELFKACGSPDVHEALGAKVSRERISGEVDRVMDSDRAPHAVGLFVELNLFDVVFRLPPQADIIGDARPIPDLANVALGTLLNLETLEPPKKCAASRRLTRYAALLSPLAGCVCLYSDGGKKRKEVPVAKYILRAELRLSAKDVADVCNMHSAAEELKSLVHKGLGELDRLETGRVIRAAGPHWRSALQVALVTELRPGKAEDTYATGVGKTCDARGSECEILVHTYGSFGEKVDEMGLDGVWDLRPTVNGNELLRLLPKLKKGPIMGKIMKEQIDWSIENPEKNADDLREWLIEKYAEFR